MVREKELPEVMEELEVRIREMCIKPSKTQMPIINTNSDTYTEGPKLEARRPPGR